MENVSLTRTATSAAILTNSQKQHHNHNLGPGNQGNQNRRRNQNNQNKPEGPKREAILDLTKYKDQEIRVKFIGGRQIVGLLKGFDQLMNLVLENVKENIRGT